MKMTLGEAAKHSGLNKSTISRAIKDGKLSAEKSDETGSYKIDMAELERYREAVRVARAVAELMQQASNERQPSQVTTRMPPQPSLQWPMTIGWP